MSFRSRTAVLSLAAVVAAPALAGAQAAPAAPAAATAASSAPLLAFAPIAPTIKAGTTKWAIKKVTPDGKAEDFGSRTVTVQPGAAGSWVVLDAQVNAMVTMADSLFVQASDLSMKRQARTIEMPQGSIAMTMEYGADSVRMNVEAQGQKQAMAVKSVAGAQGSDVLLMLALPAVQLAPGWTGRIELLNPQMGGTMPLTLTVKGTEKVTVPAGTFDTFVVEATNAMQGPVTLYVAKGGSVVKAVQNVPQLGANIETVLTK